MFATLLNKVSLGSPSIFRNLTLTPILLKDGPLSPIEPLSLEEALDAGHFRVTEARRAAGATHDRNSLPAAASSTRRSVKARPRPSPAT